MDTLAKLKLDYITEISVQYKNLVNSLQNIPVNQQFKTFGFMNLDQGIMWFQKGIEILTIEENKEPEKELEKEPEPIVESENKTIY